MNNLNYVYYRWNHHANRSGYDLITQYLPGNEIRDVPSWLLNRIFCKIYGMFKGKRGVGFFYTNEELITELLIVLKLLTSNNNIFHFLYGEETYYYTGFFPFRRKNKLVCSFHLPPSAFDSYMWRKDHIDKLDGIFVVSNSQHSYFSNIIGPDKVFFVPHGIDTDYFVPGQRNKAVTSQPPFCLFVGHHLRDLNVFKETLTGIQSKNTNIEFKVVATKENIDFFRNLKFKNLSVYYHIKTNDLISFYQNASLLVLPLVDCTANNVILEAMSSGLPVITTDIGGIRDYIDETCAILTKPGDSSGVINSILDLMADPHRREVMGINARKKALNFSWPLIAEKTRKAYEKLLS